MLVKVEIKNNDFTLYKYIFSSTQHPSLPSQNWQPYVELTIQYINSQIKEKQSANSN